MFLEASLMTAQNKQVKAISLSIQSHKISNDNFTGPMRFHTL